MINILNTSMKQLLFLLFIAVGYKDKVNIVVRDIHIQFQKAQDRCFREITLQEALN